MTQWDKLPESCLPSPTFV